MYAAVRSFDRQVVLNLGSVQISIRGHQVVP